MLCATNPMQAPTEVQHYDMCGSYTQYTGQSRSHEQYSCKTEGQRIKEYRQINEPSSRSPQYFVSQRDVPHT